MKYYIMRFKNQGWYLSRTLCRVDKNGLFEIYSYSYGSSGEWVKNDVYEEYFKNKDEDFEIYVPDENEIKYVMAETDDAAYDSFHEHYYSFTDSKGNKHTDYIYQDYRHQEVKKCEKE